jgi:hypothetical protein
MPQVITGKAMESLLIPRAFALWFEGGPLAYSVTTGTVDVDTFESDLSTFEAELREARTESGLPVVIQRAAIADMPWD